MLDLGYFASCAWKSSFVIRGLFTSSDHVSQDLVITDDKAVSIHSNALFNAYNLKMSMLGGTAHDYRSFADQ